MQEIKKTIAPLHQHPKMLLEVLKKCGGPIKAEIMKALEEVKSENPKFKQVYENKLAKIEANQKENANLTKEERIAKRLANQETRKANQEKKRLANQLKRKANQEKRRAAALEKKNSPQEEAEEGLIVSGKP